MIELGRLKRLMALALGFAAGRVFDADPTGFTLDLEHTASTMGLSFAKGHNSPFGKALHRCVMFGLAHPMNDGFAVRRKFPTVAQRHLKRLPADLQATHDEWARRTISVDRDEIERRLIEAGVSARAAVRACEAVALAS